nr:PepSY domain-containing protein [Vibrio aquaticus]
MQTAGTEKRKARYFLVWRWHFYAGLFVIPFMLMLSITGIVMLFDDEIEALKYQDILYVEPQAEKLPLSTQLSAVSIAYPDSAVTQVIVAQDESSVSRFNVIGPDGNSQFVTVNPYTADVLGTIDRSESWYQLANDIHGTLLVGKWGDYLIEMSASLSILLLVTGVYLWLPRDNASRAGFFKIRFHSTRVLMRDLHANLGGGLSIVLLLFLLSGLAWAGIWGGKMVQGWNTFPTYYTWGEKPQSLHKDLNHSSEEELPWNLELAPVPESSHHGHEISHQSEYSASEQGVGLDKIAEYANSLNLPQYRIFLPRSDTGVYTIAANSMAGDVTDPRQDRTVHIDQYSGDTLMEVTWSDYSLIAKAMAAGVSLHQGDLSALNKWLNVLFCLTFIAISLTGFWMWWVRRPNNLGVPPRFEQDGIWRVGLATVVMLCLLFPLAGVAVIACMLVDLLIVKRSPKLKEYLS